MAIFNSYVSLPEGIRPTLYHGQNMATHKFNKGTSWKSMQFTHPHVSKYFLYGHNKGYQHVSTTTSPPCQAMLNHPKSPIDQYIHHQIFFIQSFIHIIPAMIWSLAPLYPRSSAPNCPAASTWSSKYLERCVLGVVAGIGGQMLGLWAAKIGKPFFFWSKSCYSVDVPLEQLRGGAAFQWIDRESDKTNSWV